ncbi:MAG: Na(+)-translocating NADH-quinone reductase subunit C [Bacteriovoracaceae bacterium]|nr:Na(+)-translocating NADH-quinone reductase subunit C [Bacteriovoracaceae bacterium]
MSETAGKTITVAAVLCGVCSVLVAGAVVVLKPKQIINQDLDLKKNILMSSGLYQNDQTIDQVYQASVTPVVVDLTTGEQVADLDATKFDQDKADKDPQYLVELSKEDDKAGIRRISRLQKVFLVKKEGQLDQIVLHLYGKGLWSTMKGFLAVDKDGMTVRGFNYYSHGETPGLGGEVDNPRWKAIWPGKKLYDGSGSFEPKIDIVKGSVNPQSEDAAYQVDGLSGATLTSNGVENTFKFWFAKNGYSNFLAKVREGVIQ